MTPPVRLFPSAPELSRLILGTSTFGRENPQAACFALLDGARERGINLIDTAATYSGGASESIIGAWLAARRLEPGRMMVATKLYPPFTAGPMDQALTASASRLGLDVIDLLYLHKWDPQAATEEALRTLDGFVRSGRVRSLGVSNVTAAQLRSLLELQARLGLTPIRVLQNNHNLALRDVDEPLRQLCAQSGVAIVTYSPLGAGYLTGKHRQGVQPGSRFDVAPGHREIYFTPEAERRLDHLAAVAARTGQPMAHLALAWAMHQPGIAAVLIGGREPRHLDQAFAALRFDDPALFAELGRG